jgi:two-component system NarL family sensor kinase
VLAEFLGQVLERGGQAEVVQQGRAQVVRDAPHFAQHLVEFLGSAFEAGTRLPQVVGTVLFRIAQEALTNIERHADAHRISLSLERRRHELALAIEDDGAGFDTEDVAVHPQRGIGLRNMMERLDAIGGHLDIASSAAGTTVCASVELET